MIFVDSSVWIANIRALDTPGVRILRSLDPAVDPVLVGDIVLLEVLQGARNDQHAEKLEHWLRRFPIVPVLDPTIAVRAADYHRTLRARGVTLRKTIDLIIGTFCIEHGHTLLHDDRDFVPMATHLGLKIMPLAAGASPPLRG